MEGNYFSSLQNPPSPSFNLQAEVEMERSQGHTSVSRATAGQGAHAPCCSVSDPPPSSHRGVPLDSCSAVVPSQFRLGEAARRG